MAVTKEIDGVIVTYFGAFTPDEITALDNKIKSNSRIICTSKASKAITTFFVNNSIENVIFTIDKKILNLWKV